MSLDKTTFDYLEPTAHQKSVMHAVRNAGAAYAEFLDRHIPDGPDKTYLLRKLREVAMWANVAITRQPDGQPRADNGRALAREYPPDHPAPGDLGSVPL